MYVVVDMFDDCIENLLVVKITTHVNCGIFSISGCVGGDAECAKEGQHITVVYFQDALEVLLNVPKKANS